MKKIWQKFINFQAELNLKKEITSILVFALGLFWLISLLSYNALDNKIHIDDGFDYHNWLGPLGAWVSDICYSFFGIFILAGPIFIFFKRWGFSKSLILGLSLVYLGLSPLLSQFIPVEKYSFPIGGFLGIAIKTLYSRYVGGFGLYLISMTLITLGVLIILGKNGYLKILNKFNTRPPHRPHPNPLPQVGEGKQEEEINIIERDKKDLDLTNTISHNTSFSLPPLKLLDYDSPSLTPINQARIKNEADRLHKAFMQFGIEGQIREIRPGPVVTMYEYVPAPGIKLSRIAALSDDIAMAMSAIQVRIVTPIPGKGAVGIEVPNEKKETVFLKEIVADEKYRNEKHPLCMAVGKNVEGQSYFMNLADMPHILIAGTTGSGKSVSVNAMICSILYKATPKEVRFLMIDPKMLELSIYNGIPHLLLPPIIDAKKAANALKWAVKEMDDRYNKMKEFAVRDITAYNQRAAEHLPYIVVVIDEYADLLAVSGKEVESLIMRLAQKARACGIHVMLATQRPSVDVITGVIKANFPVRMSFRLASAHDSKTIINKNGAEKLLGKGDCLIMPPGTSDVIRIHGAFISEKELNLVVDFLKQQKNPSYDESIAEFNEEENASSEISSLKEGRDEKFNEAVEIARQYQKCSTSFIQRQLSVGYNRAARIVEQMEKEKMVGPVLNAKGEREIFVK